MKKRNVILASILGASALAIGVTGVIISNSNNQTNSYIEENLSFNESTLAEDGIFAQGFSSDKLEYPVLMAENETSEIVKPKIGCQYAYADGKVSIRFFAAIASEKVDAVWTRALYDSNGNETSILSKGTRQSTVAYSKLAYYDGSVLKTKSAINEEDENGDHPYKYYVIYTITDIPVSTYGTYELRAFLELSNKDCVIDSKTGSVNPTDNPTLSSYEIKLDMNNTAAANSNSAGNGQDINYKAKTIYSMTDDLDTSYITPYYGNTAVSIESVTGYTKGKEGKQTLTVNTAYGAANYDIFVVDTAAYQDENDNYVVTVDQNYTGVIGANNDDKGNMFTTISQALEFLQDENRVEKQGLKILNIGAGYYYEKLEITTPNLTINGAGSTKATYKNDVNFDQDEYDNATIIEFDSLAGIVDTNGFTHRTDSTQTVAVRDTAVNCKISGVTISNYYNNISRYADTSYAGNGERGLALLCQADRFQMDECALLGWQDTVEFFTGRQYIKDTYICGTIDYIFGTNSTTYFDGCTIETIKSKTSYTSDNTVSAYVTAFKGVNKGGDSKTYGAVFNDCTFKNSSDFVGKYAIARPWTEYSNVVIVNSTFEGKAATAENETIATGLINNVNVSTLNIKLYGNKDSNGNPFTLTDNLSNVDTSLTQEQAAAYATYTASFATTNGYSVSWNPTALPLIEKNFVFNSSGNYDTASEIDLTDFTSVEVKPDTVGFKGKIKLSVKANSLVEIDGYSDSYTHFTVDGNQVFADSYFYYSTAGTLVIDSGSTTSYINSIKVYENIENSNPSVLSGIIVENAPANEYIINENYDISGIKVKAIYSNGVYEYVTSYTTDDETAIDKTKAGVYTVTVTYGVETATFTVKYVSNVSDTFDENAVIDFSTSSKLAQSLANNKITYAVGFTYNDHSDSIQLQSATSYFSFKVKAGAIITVTSFGGEYGYLLIDGVSNNSATTYTTIATTDKTITISAENSSNTGNSWSKSYLKKIEITYLENIESNTSINFGSNGNYSSNNKFYCSNARDNGGNNSEVSNQIIMFNVLSGATINISSYPSYTNYTIKVDGVTSDTQTGTSYSVTASNNSPVIITAGSNNYFYSISITYNN